VGRLKGSVWERFNRLQQNAALVLGDRRHPRGAFKFKTYEEHEDWNREVSLQPTVRDKDEADRAWLRAKLGLAAPAPDTSTVTVPRWLWVGVLSAALVLGTAWVLWFALGPRWTGQGP